MTATTIAERTVLVLTDQVLEATDLAGYVADRNLGRVVSERDADSALRIVKTSKDNITLAVIGIARSPVVDDVIKRLTHRKALVILLDGKEDRATFPVLVVDVARPFTDADLNAVVDRHDLWG